MSLQQQIERGKAEMLGRVVEENWPHIADKAYHELLSDGRGVFLINPEGESPPSYRQETDLDELADDGVDVGDLKRAVGEYDPLTSVVVVLLTPPEMIRDVTDLLGYTNEVYDEMIAAFATPIFRTYSFEPAPADLHRGADDFLESLFDDDAD